MSGSVSRVQKLRGVGIRSALALTAMIVTAATLSVIGAAPASAQIRPDTVIDTIGGFNGAWGTAVNQVTDALYVANVNSNNVSVIDASTDSVTTTIPVGTAPYGVAVDTVTNFIYVPNSGSGTVSVINGATNAVVSTIGVGGAPCYVTVDQATNMVYVTNAASGTVSVISGATSSAPTSAAVTATVTVGSNPQGIAVDAATDTIYVANYNSGTVSVINGATNAVTNTIAVGSGPQTVAVDSQTDAIYVTNYNSNSVSVINGATSSITVSIPVGSNPYGVVIDQENNMAYVANSSSGTVSVINGLALAVVDTINVGTSPRGLAVNVNTNFIYAGNYGSNTVSVIAGATPAWNYPTGNPNTATPTLGTDPVAGIAMNTTTNTVYAIENGDLYVLNGTTNTVITTITLGGYTGMAIAVDPNTNMIYVSTNENEVAVINGATNTLIGWLMGGSDEVSMSFDGVTNILYVADLAGQEITAINFTTNTETTISTDYQGSYWQPTSVAINTANNTLYVGMSNGYIIETIDAATNTITGTMSVGGEAIAIAADSANNMIYSANGDGCVSVINGADNIITDTVCGWDQPSAIAIDPNTGMVYVSDASLNAQRTLILNGSTNTLVGSLPEGEYAGAVVVDPITNIGYVSSDIPSLGGYVVGSFIWESQLSSYRSVGTIRTSTIQGNYPTYIAANSVTNTVYAASDGWNGSNYGSQQIAVINGANNNLSDVIGAYPDGPIAVDQETNRWYMAVAEVGSSTNGELLEYLGQNNSEFGGTPIDGSPEGIAVDPNTNLIYTSSYTHSTIDVINGATLRVTGRYSSNPSGEGYNDPGGLALNPNTNTLYIGNFDSCPSSCGAANTINVFNTTTNTVTAAINLGSNYSPVNLAVNTTTNTVYTANYSSNSVSVIDGATNTVVATIPVGSSPEGIAVDPITNSIYVANSGSDTISVIDGATNTVVATINQAPGFNPEYVAANSRTNTFYVSTSNGSAPAVFAYSGRMIPTTVSPITASPNPQYVGMPVTFSATVSPAPEFATMDFTSNGTTIPGCGYVPIEKSTGQNPGLATCTTTYTTPGTYNIVANNSGDVNYAPSFSSTLSEVISQVPTATRLSSSANPVLSDNLVTYTATVSPTVSGAPTPTSGTVSFTDNGAAIAGCTAQSVNSSGQATCELPYAAPGSHAILVSYSGSTNYASSTSSTLTETITSPIVSAPSLSAGSTSLAVGQSTTLTATSPNEPNGTSISMNIPSGVTGSGPSGCYTATGGAMTCSENVVSNTAGTYNFSATANLAGNMVPDSTLKYATYPNNPTWTPRGGTFGTSPGQMSIANAGSDNAQIVTYNTGGGLSNQGLISQTIALTPGATYTLSASVNASSTTAGTGWLFLTTVGNTNPEGGGSGDLITIGIATGFNGQVSGSATIPAGVTQGTIITSVGAYVGPSGSQITYSNLQLTQTGSVQPYAPGAIAAASATSNSESISWTQPLTPPVVSASPTTQTVANSVTITAVGTNEGSGVTIGFNNPANVSQVSQSCATSGSTITCTEQVTTTVAGTYDFSATAYPPPGVSVSPETSNIVGVTWTQPSPPSGYEFMPTSMTRIVGPPKGARPTHKEQV